jgi:hypothetical protein
MNVIMNNDNNSLTTETNLMLGKNPAYRLLLPIERFKMKLNSNQEETLMYLSRMLVQHDDITNIESRALIFTIEVRSLANTISMQNAIYQKIHRILYGKLSSANEKNFSIMIAGDVENSRSGYTPVDVLKNPLLPHYHGLMLFSVKDWEIINANLSHWIAEFRRVILEIQEVKPSEIDSDGVYLNESIWIKPFKTKKSNGAKHHSALAAWISYMIKCDLLANKQSIGTYQPTVFPYDKYMNQPVASKAEIIFNKLYRQQQEFEINKRSKHKVH